MADTIALVGGETLLGREIRDVFTESGLGVRLRLVAADEQATGKLTEIDGAAAFLAKLDPDAVADSAIVILAGTRKASREVLDTDPEGVILDLTYEAEDDPEARVRAPQAEPPEFEPEESGLWIVAHPAATAIAIALRRLHRAWPFRGALVHIFEPASERGKAGIDELQQQTVSLLSFQPMPKALYDAQVTFNLLPRLGDEAASHLLDIEDRIERHLATLLDRGDGVPMPSLRLIQSPAFHGYSFSLWVEFEDAPSPSEVEEAFAGDFIDVRTGDVEPPTSVGSAGQSGIAVGAITPDRNNGNAVWIWMAADNLRLAAESAALLARSVL